MRQFLKSCTAITCAITIAAPSLAAEMVTEIGAGEGQVNIVAWPGYIERGETVETFDWVTKFEEATGCMVNVKTANTSDEMVALMNEGGFDLVTASGDASLRMIAGNIAGAQVPSYGVQGIQQLGAKSRSELNLESPIAIFDNAMLGCSSLLLFYQQTVGCQLQHVRSIGFTGGGAGLDLHRDHAPRTLYQIVRHACQPKPIREKGTLTAIPGAGVDVGHRTLWEAGSLAGTPSTEQQPYPKPPRHKGCQKQPGSHATVPCP